jgi:hypothetical protein
LEYYEEIFQLSYAKTHRYNLDGESLILVLLWGVKEDLMDTLNLLANGDIFQLTYDNIKKVFNI